MVRKLIALTGTLGLLVAALAWQPPPAAAAAVTKVVIGHNLKAANMIEYQQDCAHVLTSNPPGATPVVRTGGSRGTSSIGWQTKAAPFAVGALAPVFHPTTLNTFVGDVYVPAGSGSGVAVAAYYDNTSSGYWLGYHLFNHTGSGFVAKDFSSATYWWNYIDPANSANNQYNIREDTLPGWALSLDGDARGARVGILMGCDGRQFFLDNLRVADGIDQTVYDFEAAPSISGLFWYEVKKKGHKKKYVYHTDRLGVWYGTKFSLLGAGFDTARKIIFPGSGSLYEKRAGRSSFVRTQSGTFNSSKVAAFSVKPKSQTTYAFVSNATSTYAAVPSNPITVDVYAGMSGRIKDRSLKPGQRAVITGRIAPGDRGTKVSLQRKLGSRWATVDTTRTAGGGSFGVSVKATRVGKMTLRLNVGSPRKGIYGAYSESVQVIVTPRPKPPPRPPHGGSGNTTQTATTSTASSAPAPVPTPDDARIMARLVSQVPPAQLTPLATPACLGPGAYALPPCPPGDVR